MAWRLTLAVLLFALPVTQGETAAAPAELAGYWNGTMTREDADLPVSMELFAGTKGLEGRFTSPTQRTMDYPFDSVKTDGDAVEIVLGGEMTFQGRIAADRITGTFKDGDGQGTFALRRATKPVLPYQLTEVTFRNGAVTLAGSLIVPTTSGKHPAVVLLQGSGPETRWDTNRFIADRFARAGIVTLIFDKRGSGASAGDWRTADYTDLARDALSGIALLRERPEVDAERIGLHGHSQGGMIAPIAATLAPAQIAFIVAEDTYAGPVWQQDIYRVRNALEREFPAEAERAMKLYTLFIEVARGLRPYEELEAASAPVVSEPWFEWLAIPPPRRRQGVEPEGTPGHRGVREDLQAAMGVAQRAVQRLALYGPPSPRRPGHLPLRQAGHCADECQVFQRYRHLSRRSERDEERHASGHS